MSAAFDLDRFVSAQAGAVYEQALAELRAGEKRSHWMWFIFPQIAGLGRSPTAIPLRDRIRGQRRKPIWRIRCSDCAWCECVKAILALPENATAQSIFGGIDAVKLRSSLTLFEAAGKDEAPFAEALERYFDGDRDEATLRRLPRDRS